MQAQRKPSVISSSAFDYRLIFATAIPEPTERFNCVVYNRLSARFTAEDQAGQ